MNYTVRSEFGTVLTSAETLMEAKRARSIIGYGYIYENGALVTFDNNGEVRS